MRYLIFLFFVQTSYGQSSLDAAFGLSRNHQFFFHKDGTCKEIYKTEKGDSTLERAYMLTGNRIALWENLEFDRILLISEFVIDKDSFLIDLSDLNSYAIKNTENDYWIPRFDLLKNKNLKASLDLKVKLSDNDTLSHREKSKSIVATLFNKSPDTIRVMTMSCSYQDFFTTNFMMKAILPGRFCYSNYPVMIAIAPGCSVNYSLEIRVLEMQNPLRIGFYGLSANEYLTEFDLMRFHYQNRKEGEVIWSNEIKL